ncbi:unnamed protein product [Candidula unifasciata]|uniref:Aquaporin n=1 Tax=Candidula unifasciata TaxID=100452 RepID=A0A8S3Z542_9EUPU|nr:unnamed protein product [Candidula unifasciata]
MSRDDFHASVLRTTKTYGIQNRLGHKLEDRYERFGLDDVTQLNFYRQLFTEFFGSFVLVTLGCSAITPYKPQGSDAHLNMASIILSWGFTIATVVWTIAHVSGCFLNPAVTISMFINSRIPLTSGSEAIVVSQVSTTCQTLLNRELGIDEFKGCVIEFFITFILLFFVFATTDHHRMDHGGSHALMIGGVIIPLVNMAAELTGAGMNPARSFGPALIHGNWDAHWVYWVGPIGGGITGGLLYDLVFSERVIAWSRYLQVGHVQIDE